MTRRRSGAALSDRYELDYQLGAGGMAEVYLGRDRVLGRTVAVKTLLGQYAGDQHFIERFRREAQAAASLNHPNIVGVYDTGSDDGTHYIVMEYIEGTTLREVIREEGPLFPERAAEIAADVCSGLSFAHAHGIVHRDIKPANIMITPSGAVKVTDFGIARAASGETVTQTAMVLGTAQYFSPEQAHSAPVDARSDLYSLGVVLYEMLTRQPPFTGSSPVAIAYKHVKETPIQPSRLNPDIPASLEAIVLKAMAKNPDNRYQSAEEMREDLLRALHGQPVEATPVMSDVTGVIPALSDETIVIERPGGGYASVRRPPTAEQRRRRTGIILLSIIVLAILGVGAWAFMGILGGASVATVPDVRGESISTATDRLQKAGFQFEILDPIYSDKYAGGTVAMQNPAPGERVDKRTVRVKLAVSRGVDFIQAPDIVGKTETQARQLIEAAGLTVGDITRETSPTVGFGRVIRQDPTARGSVQRGSPVDFTVSSGRPTAIVPDVQNFLSDDACNRIEGEGFKCQVLSQPQSAECSVEVGRVCRQDPEAGARIATGSTVTVYVAQEPTPEPSPSPSPSPSVPVPTDSATPMPTP